MNETPAHQIGLRENIVLMAFVVDGKRYGKGITIQEIFSDKKCEELINFCRTTLDEIGAFDEAPYDQE